LHLSRYDVNIRDGGRKSPNLRSIDVRYNVHRLARICKASSDLFLHRELASLAEGTSTISWSWLPLRSLWPSRHRLIAAGIPYPAANFSSRLSRPGAGFKRRRLRLVRTVLTTQHIQRHASHAFRLNLPSRVSVCFHTACCTSHPAVRLPLLRRSPQGSSVTLATGAIVIMFWTRSWWLTRFHRRLDAHHLQPQGQ